MLAYDYIMQNSPFLKQVIETRIKQAAEEQNKTIEQLQQKIDVLEKQMQEKESKPTTGVEK